MTKSEVQSAWKKFCRQDAVCWNLITACRSEALSRNTPAAREKVKARLAEISRRWEEAGREFLCAVLPEAEVEAAWHVEYLCQCQESLRGHLRKVFSYAPEMASFAELASSRLAQRDTRQVFKTHERNAKYMGGNLSGNQLANESPDSRRRVLQLREALLHEARGAATDHITANERVVQHGQARRRSV